jgi:hypothetical protein
VVRGRGLRCIGVRIVVLLCAAPSRAGASETLSDGGAAEQAAVGPAHEATPVNGTLDLLSTPAGVSVEIDGTAAGVTPLVGIPLSPGTHHLRLHGRDLKPLEKDIEAQAGQGVRVSLLLSPTPPKGQPLLGNGLDVPLASAVLAGTAAVLFGVGLGFGISANDVEHRAGVTVSSGGVDLGLTRAQVLQGKQDAHIANGLYVGAGVALVTAVVLAVVLPHHPSEPLPDAQASQGSAEPPPLERWSFW